MPAEGPQPRENLHFRAKMSPNVRVSFDLSEGPISFYLGSDYVCLTAKQDPTGTGQILLDLATKRPRDSSCPRSVFNDQVLGNRQSLLLGRELLGLAENVITSTHMVSNGHCVVENDNGTLVAWDYGSTHGTIPVRGEAFSNFPFMMLKTSAAQDAGPDSESLSPHSGSAT